MLTFLSDGLGFAVSAFGAYLTGSTFGGSDLNTFCSAFGAEAGSITIFGGKSSSSGRGVDFTVVSTFLTGYFFTSGSGIFFSISNFASGYDFFSTSTLLAGSLLPERLIGSSTFFYMTGSGYLTTFFSSVELRIYEVVFLISSAPLIGDLVGLLGVAPLTWLPTRASRFALFLSIYST